ncbi:MAG: hypothetical protein KF832_21235 [Caldilineaceae bacterium]|nr:hypothetical protein [Caldilineaceae bacterium]
MAQTLIPINRVQVWLLLLAVLGLTACTPLLYSAATPEENPAVRNVHAQLVQQLRLAPTAVELGNVSAERWPDSCLGAPRAEEICAPIPTTGYRVPLLVAGQEYLYHTNQNGRSFRLVATPPLAIGTRVLTWTQRDENGCQTIEAGTEGVAFGLCGTPLLGVPYGLPTRQPDINWLAGYYRAFGGETPAGSVDFVGNGPHLATANEQRMIAEWARLVFQEAQAGDADASRGLVLAWQRSGGDPAACVDVILYRTGDAELTRCQAAPPEPLGRVRLMVHQLALLYTWVDTLQAFSAAEVALMEGPATVGDLRFVGAGSQVATLADQQAIALLAEQLRERVIPPEAPAAAEEASPAMFTYASAEGGFHLQYPPAMTLVRNIRPHVALPGAEAANTVALIGFAPRYVLSISWFDLADRTVLQHFIDAYSECPASIATPGQPFELAGHAAVLFPDLPCDPVWTTYLFAVVGQRGYRIAVETSDLQTYADVQAAVEALLATLTFDPPPFPY